MIKILILVIVIIGVGFISYQQGTKNTSYKDVETKDVEIVGDEVFKADIKTDINTNDSDQNLDGKYILNLSAKNLSEVPKFVFGETSIETLNLSHNKLTGSLPAEIRHIRNLKVLDLSNNQFTGVPAEIGQLKYLEVLDLSNNRITGLPLELGNLSNLKILNLKNNQYSKYDLELIREKLSASVVIQVD